MKSLTCENITALLPKYIENTATNEEAVQIEEHLCHCQECFEKYLSLKNIADKIKSAFNNIESSDFAYEQKFFKNNISAYIDNELDKIDSFALNCYMAKSPKAKEELESMRRFEETLKLNIENNKKILQNDLSKSVIDEFKKDSPEYIYNLYVKAAAVTVIFIMLTICAGYFSVPDNMDKLSGFTSQILAHFSAN